MRSLINGGLVDEVANRGDLSTRLGFDGVGIDGLSEVSTGQSLGLERVRSSTCRPLVWCERC